MVESQDQRGATLCQGVQGLALLKRLEFRMELDLNSKVSPPFFLLPRHAHDPILICHVLSLKLFAISNLSDTYFSHENKDLRPLEAD